VSWGDRLEEPKLNKYEVDKKNEEMIIEYQKTKDIKIRNEIIMFNIELIHYATSKIIKQYIFTEFSYDDIFNYAVIGAIKGIDRYDASKGKLSAILYSKSYYNILDELRSVDMVPRSTRDKIKAVKSEMASLENNFAYYCHDYNYTYVDYGLTQKDYNLMMNNCFVRLDDNNSYLLEYKYA
jgi:DNA-directed RNA polymerase specialized sigma subunit